MFWLGKMMVEGRGGLVEVDRGVEWLEAAAAQGQIRAQRKLLVVKRQRSDSVFRKLLIQCQIVALAKDLAKEVWTDANSDKIR